MIGAVDEPRGLGRGFASRSNPVWFVAARARRTARQAAVSRRRREPVAEKCFRHCFGSPSPFELNLIPKDVPNPYMGPAFVGQSQLPHAFCVGSE
ncbi:hypothetical protein HPP92_026738 [Vanilla planifolia]|uniref:Uncharacterized protein n=1 Tax=Vanilla planifolia TaxID=51239 RepID=A0A835PG51_VANPL|nr:hypothetical protein HPP92_026738 [Vanilla planifolia]